jgi:hypothetical protein
VTRLVCIDEPHAPPEQRGLFAAIDDHGATLAVGYIEPDGDVVALSLAPGSTTSLRFRVIGGTSA